MQSYLSRVDPLAGERIVVGSHFGGLLSWFVDVEVASYKSSKVQVDFANFDTGCAAIGLSCDRLKHGPDVGQPCVRCGFHCDLGLARHT